MSRPKGSKNKPKKLKETSLEIKRIKKEIKDLQAQKRQTVSKDERRTLRVKIKELKGQLVEKKEVKLEQVKEFNDPEKEKLINEIYILDPFIKRLDLDLRKYDEKTLKKHIEYLKRKRGNK